MRASFVLILVVILAICFITDPTPTVAEDTTDKTTERYLYNTPSTDNSSNNNNNDKYDQKKNVDLEHSCPRCNSHSLTFEGLDTAAGRQIQLINCKACGFEWQETWTLHNWFWLKSSLPYNHWTSERWNKE
jgi:DNA-directed RNA polymerase subunit M/transcription elongation factor TFIIS